MQVFDLSHQVEGSMPVYPGSPKPVISEISSITSDGFRENLITISTHTGTHIDVPAHLLSKGRSLSDYPSDYFLGNAICVNCIGLINITKSLISEILQYHNIPDYILFHTGWDLKWGTDQYYRDFPVLDGDAAAYITSLNVKGVGIDAISFDKMHDKELNNHRLLMAKGIILVENLCNLDILPHNDFLFSCMPVKFNALDGCPVRAFGLTI
jgi:arylformamidase